MKATPAAVLRGKLSGYTWCIAEAVMLRFMIALVVGWVRLVRPHPESVLRGSAQAIDDLSTSGLPGTTPSESPRRVVVGADSPECAAQRVPS